MVVQVKLGDGLDYLEQVRFLGKMVDLVKVEAQEDKEEKVVQVDRVAGVEAMEKADMKEVELVQEEKNT